eukprot:3468979-Rhodomonas_salina.2
MVGGFGGSQAPDAEVVKHLESLKADILKSHNEARGDAPLSGFEAFEALECRTQVVAGTNYQVKVRIGSEKFINVQFHVPLPHTGQGPQLMHVTSE